MNSEKVIKNSVRSYQFYSLLSQVPEPREVQIEVHSIFQIPSFSIIGLAAQEIFESRERIRSAIDAQGLEFPKRKVTVNLSPANIPKSGVGHDLAIALSVLESERTIGEKDKECKILVWGELGLSGTVKSSGQCVRLVSLAFLQGFEGILIESKDLRFAYEIYDWLKKNIYQEKADFWIFGVKTLKEAHEFLENYRKTNRPPIYDQSQIKLESTESNSLNALDDEIRISPLHLRILKLILTGGHHCLFLGPKGSGKSYLLNLIQKLALPQKPKMLLFQSYFHELIECQTKLNGQKRPSRIVHSQVRPQALLGRMRRGGIRPGELSLAHGGFLVADEFLEWHRDSIDALRLPLESGAIHLTQAEGSIVMPAQFQLIAAANLCRCGQRGGENSKCVCSESSKMNYLSKASGPVFDRIDFALVIKNSSFLEMQNQETLRIDALESEIREAQFLILNIWGVESVNISGERIERELRTHDFSLVFNSIESIRSRHKMFRMAVTLAALERKTYPGVAHFSEAVLYRPERIFSNI